MKFDSLHPEGPDAGRPAVPRPKKRKSTVHSKAGVPESASVLDLVDLEIIDSSNLEPLSRPGFYSRLLVRWVALPILGVSIVAGGAGVALFRSLQTYSHYEWTLLPISDTRIEAACGELKLYYLPWQNPRANRPFGHVVNPAATEQCAASKTNPNPSDRFRGLANPQVLKTLGCKPEGGNTKTARAWSCTQPVGALLKREIESRTADQVAQ